MLSPPPAPVTDAAAPPADTAPVRPARLHLGHVDGLRALAALFVVCVHYLPVAWGRETPSNPVFRALAKVLSGGHFAVSTFIVISGFCLMLPALRDGLSVKGGYRRFLPRRFFRIAPPLYAAFLLSLLLLPSTLNPKTGHLFAASDGWNTKTLFSHLFLVQHLTGLLPSNGPLWSVGVEWWIYFWFPPVLWLWRRKGGLIACAAAVAVTFALAFVSDYAYRLPFVVCPQYLGLFALGALSAHIACGTDKQTDKQWEAAQRFPWLIASVASAFLLAAIVAKLGWERAYRHISLLDLFIAVSVPALLIACQQERNGWLRRLLGAKPLAFVGVFSYSLYLIHYPLSLWVLPRVFAHFPDASQTARFAIILALFAPLIALAYGFYRAFEAPFHKIARRF